MMIETILLSSEEKPLRNWNKEVCKEGALDNGI